MYTIFSISYFLCNLHKHFGANLKHIFIKKIGAIRYEFSEQHRHPSTKLLKKTLIQCPICIFWCKFRLGRELYWFCYELYFHTYGFNHVAENSFSYFCNTLHLTFLLIIDLS